MTNINKAYLIIRIANQNDFIDINQLYLVEMAINGLLNEKGQMKFDKLYKEVSEGTYLRSYYQNVEFMTRDQNSYIYFKGIQIGIFPDSWVHSSWGKSRLKKIQQKCLLLESKGESLRNVAKYFDMEER